MAAEVASRPNLTAVTSRIFAILATDVGPKRRDSLECLVGSLDIGLRLGEDLSERERDEWLKAMS